MTEVDRENSSPPFIPTRLKNINMRFWSPFHRYSLDIISSTSNKIVLRAPDRIRLQMTVDHLELHQDPGSCFTHYNHESCLWEFFHAPNNLGHHRLIIWALDTDDEELWHTAVRFDTYIEEKSTPFIFPSTSEVFNRSRCQLIEPMQGILRRSSLPIDVIISAPSMSRVQLQTDDLSVISAEEIRSHTYRVTIPASLANHIVKCTLMGLGMDKMYYSMLITYKIE